MAVPITAARALTPLRLATIAASRFVLNAIFRVAYPLIPFVAMSYGATREQATWIVTIQVLFGLCSPLGGWMADMLGYRRTMLLGAGVTLLGTLAVAFATSLGQLVAAYGACGLGIALYQPAMQAYVSATSSYDRRGRAVGLVELSWALSGILAVPLLVRMVAAQGALRGAFLLLGMALLATMALMVVALGEVRHGHAARSDGSLRFWTSSLRGLMAFAFLAVAGIELFYIVQPVWATDRFDATLVNLGTASLVFGLGELLGSLGSAALTDRLGKRRAVAGGFGLVALTLLLVPLISRSWGLYLAGYFLFALTAEFAIVALLTFATTVGTVGRGRVMALTITSFQLGRTIASQAGIALYAATSIALNSVAGALLVACGIAVVLLFVHDTERSSEASPSIQLEMLHHGGTENTEDL